MTHTSRSLECERLPKAYVIELRIGQPYFHAMFYDDGLTVPKIDTLVYVGRDANGAYKFQDAASYTAQQEGAHVDEIEVCRFADGDLSEVVDRTHLVDWLRDEHSTSLIGPTYKYLEID